MCTVDSMAIVQAPALTASDLAGAGLAVAPRLKVSARLSTGSAEGFAPLPRFVGAADESADLFELLYEPLMCAASAALFQRYMYGALDIENAAVFALTSLGGDLAADAVAKRYDDALYLKARDAKSVQAIALDSVAGAAAYAIYKAAKRADPAAGLEVLPIAAGINIAGALLAAYTKPYARRLLARYAA
jgi:hypothetical protein